MTKYINTFNEAINKTDKVILERSTPVASNPVILKWLVNCQVVSYENNKKNLSQNLLSELNNVFGNPNKSLRLEFMTKVWILKYGDLTFNVFTAKGKGTSIEICNYSSDDIRTGAKEQEIIQFLEELHKLINE